MTMTRKDYVKVAEIINKFFDSNIEHPVFNDTVHSNLIEPFIELFENDNPRFDSDKFIKAVSPLQVLV